MPLYYKLIFLWVFISACGYQRDYRKQYDVVIPIGQTHLHKVKKNGQWGIMGENGQLLTTIEYDLIGDLDNGIFKLYKNKALAVMNQNGDLIVPLGFYDIVTSISKDLLRVERIGIQGVIDIYGKEIVPLTYSDIYYVPMSETEQLYTFQTWADEAYAQTNDLLVLIAPQRSGICDLRGHYLIQPIYDSVALNYHGFMAFQNKKVIFFEENNQVLTPIMTQLDIRSLYEYESLDYASKTGWFKHNGKWGFMHNGKILRSAIYEGEMAFFNNYIEDDNDDYYKVYKDKHYGLLDSLSRVIVPCEYDDIDFTTIKNVFCVYKDGLCGLVKKGGEVLLEPNIRCSHIDGFYAGWARVVKDIPSANVFDCWFVNTKGETKSFSQYDDVSSFSDKGEAFAIQGSKIGIIDTAGVVKMPFIQGIDYDWSYNTDKHAATYKAIYDYYFINGLMRFVSNGKYGLINDNLQDVTTFKYDYITRSYAGDFWEVKLNDKIGIVDHNGRLIISPKYDRIEYLDKVFRVWTASKEGLFNKNGKLLIPPKYDDIDMLGNGQFVVSLESKKGLLSSRGKVITDCIYDNIRETNNENLFIVIKHSKLGVVDKNGQLIISPKYDEIELLENGLYIVSLESKNGLLGSRGETIAKCIYNQIDWTNDNDSLFIMSLRADVGLLDRFGNWVAPLQYDNIVAAGDTYVIYENGKVGVLNRQGQFIIPIQYHNIKMLDNHNYKVRFDLRNGILNKQGKLLIPLRYDDIKLFSNGNLLIQQWGRYSVLDKRGKVIIPWGCDSVILLSNGHYKVRLAKHYGIIDAQGETIVPFEYDELTLIKNGTYYLTGKGNTSDMKCGLLSKGGKLLIPAIYDAIIPMNEDWSLVNGLIFTATKSFYKATEIQLSPH